MEAMQDVFVEIVRRQERLDVASPSSFLYQTATHISLNRIRSGRRKPSTPDTELIDRIAVAPSAEERSLAQVVLDRLFNREPASTRTMATLHLVDGLTLQEVADEVGLSVSGVRKRLRILKAHVHELQGV